MDGQSNAVHMSNAPDIASYWIALSRWLRDAASARLRPHLLRRGGGGCSIGGGGGSGSGSGSRRCSAASWCLLCCLHTVVSGQGSDGIAAADAR